MGQETADLRRVARGLQLVFAELGLYVAAIIAGVVALPLGLLPGVVGKIFCLAVPRKSEGLGIIRASVVCALLGFSLILIFIYAILLDRNDPALIVPIGIAFILISLAVAASHILFLIFLRRLAKYVGSPRLARTARTIQIIVVAGLVITALLIGCTQMHFSIFVLITWILVSLSPLLLPVARIALVGLFIMYAKLILELRRATLDYAASQSLDEVLSRDE